MASHGPPVSRTMEHDDGPALNEPADDAPMVGYRVVDLSVDGRLALLLGDDEHVHVARLPGCGLEFGALLTGRPAKLGAHVLVAQGPATPLHARFESVACSQDEALILMHPMASSLTDGTLFPFKSAAREWRGSA